MFCSISFIARLYFICLRRLGERSFQPNLILKVKTTTPILALVNFTCPSSTLYSKNTGDLLRGKKVVINGKLTKITAGMLRQAREDAEKWPELLENGPEIAKLVLCNKVR